VASGKYLYYSLLAYAPRTFDAVASFVIRAHENLRSKVREVIVTKAEGQNMFNEAVCEVLPAAVHEVHFEEFCLPRYNAV
jgi:anti-sigma factor ChrR (cupin superfamily)